MVSQCICERHYCELDDLFEYEIRFVLKSENEREIQNVENIINTQVRKWILNDLDGHNIARVISSSNPTKQIIYIFNIYCPNDIDLNQYPKVIDFIIEKMIKKYPQFEFQFTYKNDESDKYGIINGNDGAVTLMEESSLYIHNLRNMTQQKFNQIIEAGINEFHHFYGHNPINIDYNVMYELIMSNNEELIENIDNNFFKYNNLRVWVDINNLLFLDYLIKFFQTKYGVSINEALDLIDMIRINQTLPFKMRVDKKIIEKKKSYIHYVDINSLSQKQIQADKLNDMCPICLEPLLNELDEDSKLVAVIKIKCGHNYHSKCIRQYLGTATCNNECPYCRTAIKMGKLYCKTI